MHVQVFELLVVETRFLLDKAGLRRSLRIYENCNRYGGVNGFH